MTPPLITQTSLPVSQYFGAIQEKKQIVLHHTAGSHRPDFAIDGWRSDNQGRVATAFVVGGLATNGNTEWDGRILQTMDYRHWAHHLGIKSPQNEALNKASVGIEICNWGYVIKQRDGSFLNYIGRPVPKEQVIELDVEWRGHKHWHSYNDKQLEATRNLLLFLSDALGIPVKKRWSVEDFTLSSYALSGTNGVWTHCQYRTDKFDCYPHPGLIQMLNSL